MAAVDWTLVAADVVDTDVRAHVVVHVDGRAVSVRQLDRGRRGKGAARERQVRVPGRVDDDRLHEPETAVRHGEGRQQPRLQGFRRRHAARLRPQVTRRISHGLCVWKNPHLESPVRAPVPGVQGP